MLRHTLVTAGRSVVLLPILATLLQPGPGRPDFSDRVLPVLSPRAMASGDFDGDGRADLAVASSAGSVEIYLGKAGGVLRSESHPVRPGADFVAAGDLNGDGRLDLLLSTDGAPTGGSRDLSILPGHGDGTFGDEIRLTVGIAPVAASLADFNGDGILDLAVADRCDALPACAGGAVSILPGRGDGTFGAGTRYAASHEPGSIVADDFDGDGHLDLALSKPTPDLAGTPGEFVLLYGYGDGTFTPPVAMGEAMSGPARLVTGDFNSDGRRDIAGAGSEDEPGIQIYLGRRYGEFEENTLSVPGAPDVVAVGDFDGDGREDLAASGGASTDVRVLIGRGDGTFLPPAPLGLHIPPGPLLVTNLVGDTRPEAAVIDPHGDRVLVLDGNARGMFGAQARTLEITGHWETALADFNGDGRLDLLVSNGDPFYATSGDLSLLPGNGDGTFGAEMHFGQGPVRGPLRVADFNGDGAADVAVGNLETFLISVFLGNGDGTFAADRRFTVGYSPGQIASGDLNGDGIVDLAVVNQGYQFPPHQPNDVSILLGRGDGSFLPELRISSVPAPIMAAIADFNGDGAGDLAVTSESNIFDDVPGSVWIFFGNAAGGLDAGPVLQAGPGTFEVVARDFDGDGRVDLAANDRGRFASGFGGGEVSLFIGRGDGTFEPRRPVTTAASPIYLAAADFNLDGILDLATGDASSETSVLKGLGDGTFAPPERFFIRQPPEDFSAGDVNGDGRPDLVGQVGNSVLVLLNRTLTDRDSDGVLDDDDNCILLPNPGQEDGDRDGHGDACDDCPAVADPSQADTDRDGTGDACDDCTDSDHDGAGDPGHPGATCPVDDCPAVADPAQQDSDHDGHGDACDDCPAAADPDQRDADHDGTGDACDGCTDIDGDGFGDPGFANGACPPDDCPAVPDPAQIDSDHDGSGDACDPCTDRDGDGFGDPGQPRNTCPPDNCPAVSNPAQADGDGDGSGDACQPSVVLSGIRQDGGGTLVVTLRAVDPQGEPLSGVIEIFPADVPITLADMGATGDCGLGFLPAGVPGRGIGYASGSIGSPVLFDMDTYFGCDDGVDDYLIGAGGCDDPLLRFADILDLSTRTPPIAVCVRGAGESSGGIPLTVTDFGPDSAHLAVPATAPVLSIPFAGGLPRGVDISSLHDGTSYRLVITVTDGNTLPVRVEAPFTGRGETTLAFEGTDAAPHAVVTAPDVVECGGPAGGVVPLDGTGSTDPDSRAGAGDIVLYQWLEDPAEPSPRVLGTGARLEVTLPLGAHTLGLRVVDSQGLADLAVKRVVVRDTEPPALDLAVDPDVLWPPNHRMVPVRVTWRVIDRCDPAPVVRLESVTSSEPDDVAGEGDGRTTEDIVPPAAADAPILLRAERSAEGSGRAYVIVDAAADASGNRTRSLAVVAVPHDLGEGPEPLIARAEPGAAPGSLRLFWNAVGGALGYDVVSGDVAALKTGTDKIDLGNVRVVARRTPAASWSEDAAAAPIPAPETGRANFYLIQYWSVSGPSGFGSEGVPLPREPLSCDGPCPDDGTAILRALPEAKRR